MSFYKNVQHIASNVTKSHLCTVIEFLYFPLEIRNRNYRLCVFTDISPPSELFLAEGRYILQVQDSTLDGMCTNVSVNPIPRGVWNYVNPWGGAIMARIYFKLYKSLKTLLSAHNLLSKQYFDL